MGSVRVLTEKPESKGGVYKNTDKEGKNLHSSENK